MLDDPIGCEALIDAKLREISKRVDADMPSLEGLRPVAELEALNQIQSARHLAQAQARAESMAERAAVRERKNLLQKAEMSASSKP
ncbi:MAG: hypothetical protein M2R45_04306 [Verrucomicrobia subdivision 3 bacterium]|nr:hypothetical protein [Limisphaerales bacterium]MCS1417221.1 hypothetical protein [Limisphaerales bacterium]